MARILDPNASVDSNLAAAISPGAPRTQRTVREGDVRSASKRTRDKFFIPPEMIPKGFVVEWHRRSCLGKEEEADYFMDLEDAGWKFAPIDQFRKLMPANYQGATVERGGLVLMMRPKHLHDADVKMRQEEAFYQVRDKLNEIGMTGQGEMKRVVTSFQRSYDRAPGLEVPDSED